MKFTGLSLRTTLTTCTGEVRLWLVTQVMPGSLTSTSTSMRLGASTMRVILTEYPPVLLGPNGGHQHHEALKIHLGRRLGIHALVFDALPGVNPGLIVLDH